MANVNVKDEMNVYEAADARFETAVQKLGVEQGIYLWLARAGRHP